MPWLETNFGVQSYFCFRPSRQSVRWRHSGKPEIDIFEPAFSASSVIVFGLPSFSAVSFVEVILYVFWNGVCGIAVMSSSASVALELVEGLVLVARDVVGLDLVEGRQRRARVLGVRVDRRRP